MTLAATSLDYGFRDHVVGRGLDATLASGEVVCLLGPNGSGKSTLLRTLLGLQARLGGQLTLEERDLGAWGAAERARHLAYVPQAADSYFDFSLREMVEMGRTAHRGMFASPGARDREIAAAALERLGIAPLADRPIHAVSGGERQLALIARALATQARYLVMDEPTANLDYGNQARVLDEVVRLGQAGIGVLLSTHHPEHALRIADRVLLLAGGRIAAQGPTQATLTSEALSALYGRPIEVATARLADGTDRRVCVPSGDA
jgi:iron complex transport system ATP-binding protein